MLAEVMSHVSLEVLFDADARIGPVFSSLKGWMVCKWTNRRIINFLTARVRTPEQSLH